MSTRRGGLGEFIDSPPLIGQGFPQFHEGVHFFVQPWNVLTCIGLWCVTFHLVRGWFIAGLPAAFGRPVLPGSGSTGRGKRRRIVEGAGEARRGPRGPHHPPGHLCRSLLPRQRDCGERGGGVLSCAAALSHFTIDHASLARRSTVPTPSKDTPNIWTRLLFVHVIHEETKKTTPIPLDGCGKQTPSWERPHAIRLPHGRSVTGPWKAPFAADTAPFWDRQARFTQDELRSRTGFPLDDRKQCWWPERPRPVRSHGDVRTTWQE